VGTTVRRVSKKQLLLPQRVRPSGIYLVTGTLVVLGLVAAQALSSAPVLGAPFGVPVWALAAGFALSEKWVIHIPLAKSTHTLTLSEVVFVVGLLFASPLALVFAVVVGGGVGLLLDPLVPVERKAFNLANYGFSAAVAALAFQLLQQYVASLPVNGTLTAISWGSALGASILMSAVSLLGIVAAMTASRQRPKPRQFRSMYGAGLATSALGGSIGVLVTITMWQSPWAALMFVPLVAAVYLGTRSMVRQRLQHERLAVLNEFTSIVLQSPSTASGLISVQERLAGLFACESARFISGGQSASHGLSVSALSHESKVLEWSDESGRRGLLIVVDPHLEEADVKELVLQGRLAAAGPFSEEEKVFALAITQQLSMLVSHGRLAASLAATKVEAGIDPLTGIGNRRQLDEMFSAAQSQSTGATLLTLDLDGFKALNDRFGHDLGDTALVFVADTLRELSEAGEIPVRLGGDEFGVLVVGTGHASRAADLAERLRLELSFSLADRLPLPIGASFGVATALPSDGMRDLLRRSDLAMYEAKRTGKGRVVVHQEPNPGTSPTPRDVIHLNG
jgi:diguanylate cyclase (GGDEF)-like protein